VSHLINRKGKNAGDPKRRRVASHKHAGTGGLGGQAEGRCNVKRVHDRTGWQRSGVPRKSERNWGTFQTTKRMATGEGMTSTSRITLWRPGEGWFGLDESFESRKRGLPSSGTNV